MDIKKLYVNRFDRREMRRKDGIWKILCHSFFQGYIPEDSAVLDIGAGYCEFINNIRCREKYAVELNEDALHFADSGVKVLNCPSTDLSPLQDGLFDVVFMSNFLEHLKSKEDVLQTLEEVFRVLKLGGKVMILQPNIRYLYKEYWDFFDHHVPLSDKSLIEVLTLAGFTVEVVLPKFLPYTSKSKFPQKPLLVKLYLKFPALWKIIGKQMFLIASKPE